MSPVPNEPAARPADWEAFYRDYRKPGYVPGFEITTKLGGGMFGLVYRARRMSIGKDYAIKFLQVDDGEVRQAVLSELEQVKYFAQIDHPNLVSIEDRGEVDGIPYLVMAFAGTETLRDKLVPKQPPTGEAKDELLRWFLQACRGLAALHERSLVHFDIKPANVFLKGGVARLGDYGLSKLVTHSRGSLSMGRGTPYYMAPEMLQRRGDQRSDVYSAGVLLYEILCGEMPFTGDSEWEVLKKHETQAPALPEHLTARECSVLQRCLQKDPAARFQSVHDLIAAFGAPTSAGAAAWTEVGAKGAASSPPLTPPPPLTSPPPLPGEEAKKGEDPYTGFGRASREAFRHANTIAHKAYQEANRVAREAAEKARKMAREAMDRSRHSGLRRAAAMQRLRRMHKSATGRNHVVAVAGSIAEGPPRPVRKARWGGAVAVAVVLFAGLVLLPVTFMAGAPTAHVYEQFDRPATVASAPAPAGTRQTFREFRVGDYGELVSLSEPRWVALAEHDREQAREVLLQHIERLRNNAPLTMAQRATALDLPAFETARDDARATQPLASMLESLLKGREYDSRFAGMLAANAPQSLVLAARRLQKIKWQDAAERERGRRLQQFLEQTTGCSDLTLIEDGAMSPAKVAAANQKLGSMWLWFVNEFAHTPRTWATFVSLMKER